jgi:hypothetical protein
MVHDALEREEIDDDWHTRLIAEVYEELQFFNTTRHPREQVAPIPALQRLAEDSQNVHTSHVVAQTAKNEKILLNVPVSKTPTTLEEISNEKLRRVVFNDIAKWYNMDMCRSPNDYLYRRLLDGLWAYIQKSQDKVELLKRFREEVTESVKMCCEGHISRLCNVLVGFDEEAIPVVSTGQLLQQRIANIALKEISVEEKVGEVWFVFEELMIPMEERNSWIEAL